MESSSSARQPLQSEKPLIVAAYLFGDPQRKRRVKVPPNISWKDFLRLFYTRLAVSPNAEIEIFDEKGIEIVSVEDLVDNDVLVVVEKDRNSVAAPRHSRPERKGLSKSRLPPSYLPSGSFPSHSHGERLGFAVGMLTKSKPTATKSTEQSQNLLHEHDPSSMGVPRLAHFIQSNSFGYYFLAEVENMTLLPTHGRIKKTHCIVKVPHYKKATGSFQTFESEANLLRRIAGHKCMISSPAVQILNFSDDALQRFFSSLPHQKQPLLRELFMGSGCSEAYMYPLYGVTMATKIKSGLSPDKVLKYAFQLADVMHYLQQKGVIHQNLLPENIQVLSNDRVIICNFETAVQTDPTTCLLIVSRSVVAPSNQKGLAPEVITAFNRTETDTVDYSTQYPWNFGILSVVMATRQHPLKDYPSAFESGGRVKYRSANYQSLPDVSMYPGIFCKLLKRSMSCDPVRRPTLPQILSVMKKDSRIISTMMGRRNITPGGSVEAGQQKGPNTDLHPAQVDQLGEDASSKHQDFHHTHSSRSYTSFQELIPQDHHSRSGNEHSDSLSPDQIPFSQAPRKRSKVDRNHISQDFSLLPNGHRATGHYPSDHQRLHDHQNYHQGQPQHEPYMSHITAHHISNAETTRYSPPKQDSASVTDPFMALETPNPQSHTSWLTFGEDSSLPFSDRHRKRSVDSAEHSRNQEQNQSEQRIASHSLHRAGSLGAFSDDFTTPLIPKDPPSPGVSSRAQPPPVLHSILPQVKPVCTSESDLSQLQDVPYQRLVSSPNLGSSSEKSPRSDQERLLIPSSPECDDSLQNDAVQQSSESPERMDISCHDVHLATPLQNISSSSKKQKSVEPMTLRHKLLAKNSRLRLQERIYRTPSYKIALNSGQLKLGSPLIMRRCFSDGEMEEQTRREKQGSFSVLNSNIDVPKEEEMEVDDKNTAECLMSLGNTAAVKDSSGLATLESGATAAGLNGHEVTMATDQSTAQTNTSLPLAQSVVAELGLATSVSSGVEQEPHDAENLISQSVPDRHSSDATVSESDQQVSEQAASPLVDITPSSPKILDQKSGIKTFPEAMGNALPIVNSESAANQSRDDDSHHGNDLVLETAYNHTNTSEALGTCSTPDATSSASISANPFTANDLQTSVNQLQERYHPNVPHGYMSPIPEASQEFTSSQTLTNTQTATSERMSLDRTLSTDVDHQLRHRSISPFHHCALSDRGSTSHSQSTVSDRGSTPIGSTVGAHQHTEAARAGSPQLEPPSSDTSTMSRSQTTHSSSEQTSLQACVSTPPPPSLSSPAIPRPRILSTQSSPTSTLADDAAASAAHEMGASNQTILGSAAVMKERASTPKSVSSAPPHLFHKSGTTRSLSPRSSSNISGGSNPAPSHASFPSAHIPLRRRERKEAAEHKHSDFTRGQHRISQDLEVMNLAISGMDSRSLLNSQQQEGMEQSSIQPPNSSPQFTVSAQHRGSRTPGLDTFQTFRPITPAVTEYRSISAGPALISSTHPNTEPAYVHNPDRQLLAASGVHDERLDAESVPPPPQMPVDSYDYLPPYSPPRAGDSPRSPSSPQPKPQQQGLALYPEAPPSYEEIFGRKQGHSSRHRRQRYSSRHQARLDIRGNDSPTQQTARNSSGGGQRRLASLTNLFRRTRPRTVNEATPTNEHPHDRHPRSSRSGHQTPPQADSAAEYTASWVASYSRTPRPVEAILESQYMRRETASVVSTGSTAAYSQAHSHVSRTASDTVAISRQRHAAQPPIPYRHPPPFPSLENIHQQQQRSPLNSRAFSGSHGAVSPSVMSQGSPRSRPGYFGYPGYRANNVPVREGVRDRQRPSSVILPPSFKPNIDTSQVDRQSGSSRDINQSRRSGPRVSSGNLVTSANISTSCFDILSPPERPSDDQTSTGRPNQPRSSSSMLPVNLSPTRGIQQQSNESLTTAAHSRHTFAGNANANNINQTSHNASLGDIPSAVHNQAPEIPETATPDGSARMRAISRRTQQASQLSSSDEEESHDQHTSRTRLRLRRRRPSESDGETSPSPCLPASPSAHGSAVMLTKPSKHLESNVAATPAQLGTNVEATPAQLGTNVEANPVQLGTNVEATPAQLDSNVAATAAQLGTNVEATPAQLDTNVVANPAQLDTNVEATPAQLELGIAPSSVEALRSDAQVNGEGASEREGEVEEISQQSEQEAQIVESALNCDPQHSCSSLPEPSPLSSGSKSCGHICHSSGEQDLCCLCLKVHQGGQPIPRVLHNCHFCERRSTGSNYEEPLSVERDTCTCCGRKEACSCSVHSAPVESHTTNRRGGRNCTIM